MIFFFFPLFFFYGNLADNFFSFQVYFFFSLFTGQLAANMHSISMSDSPPPISVKWYVPVRPTLFTLFAILSVRETSPLFSVLLMSAFATSALSQPATRDSFLFSLFTQPETRFPLFYHLFLHR